MGYQSKRRHGFSLKQAALSRQLSLFLPSDVWLTEFSLFCRLYFND